MSVVFHIFRTVTAKWCIYVHEKAVGLGYDFHSWRSNYFIQNVLRALENNEIYINAIDFFSVSKSKYIDHNINRI
jgi:hypothetical protein